MTDYRPRVPSHPSGDAIRTGSSTTASTRRERLREFQSALSERLRRAQGSALTSNRLGLQIGNRRLVVDLAQAGEILAVPDITPVPLTQTWYRGLANVRGNLLGVIDLSLFAGGPATPIDKESRVIALSREWRFAAGILVSRMLGLRSAADLSEAAPSQDPAAGDPYAPWLRAHLVDAQGARWDELDLAALAADERFMRIGRY